MAGAVDLLLYGIAIFISPVAVYFKKGVGAQFWVNCCLYCLLGVPGMIHAFYIIHTNKDDKKSGQHSSHQNSPVIQQRHSNLPSLPHSDRYKPPAPYSPYEDHPPPIPPKREEPSLAYDPALHPNAGETPIGRAKAVLHTYQIPESTLQPAAQRLRRPVPSPEPPRPEPELQPISRAQPSSSTPNLAANSNDPDAPLSYPADYHPNVGGKNIANAKAVLHTYQIPETTFPAPELDPPVATPTAATSTAPGTKSGKQKRPQTLEADTNSKGKSSMWSIRNKDKGLSALDINSPTAIPSPSSPTPRPKWRAVATGPSWLRRRKALQTQTQANTTTDEEDGPTTMTMVWNDKYDSHHVKNKPLRKISAGHERSASEPVALPFPMPPGSVRPVVDRTGTSNTILKRPGLAERGESGLGSVVEEEPRGQTMSEGEEEESSMKKLRRNDVNTDTEAARPQHRLMNRLGRRARPRLDIIGDTTPPGSAPAVQTQATTVPSVSASPPKSDSPNQNRAPSSQWQGLRHIAPPAVLASSIEEPRTGLFRQRHASNSSTPIPAAKTSPARNDIDFTLGEFGLGGAGDAYSAGSRALNSTSKERERRGSLGTVTGPMRSPKRLSSSNAATPTSDVFAGAGSNTVPVMSRGLTQGTFGTGISKASSSTGATSEEGQVGAAGSKSGTRVGHEESEEQEELSQDEQVERWIKREDERREPPQSRSPTSHGHSHSPEVRSPYQGPDESSLFSEESSGFAGIGVGTAHEKGRAGKMELWDRPDWDGSNPSAGSTQEHTQYSYSPKDTHYHGRDPFRDTILAKPPLIDTRSSYATGQESLPSGPLSPPGSPRPNHPNRAPPAIPSRSPQTPVKPAPLRMDTFCRGEGEATSFGLPSPPSTERVKEKGKERAPLVPPPIPTRPSTLSNRPQSPKLPPKPAILRAMSGLDEDDLSAIYARALRDEV